MIQDLQIPAPGERNIALHISRAAERKLLSGHPWLFENAIQKQSHAGQPGDLAVIFDHKRDFLAIGLYDPNSAIRVRVLQHHHPAPIDQEWFRQKFNAALERRSGLPKNTTAYRLIHGENDGFPGLVLDCYAHTVVMKIYSAAWIPFLRDLVTLCLDLSPKRIVLRLGRDVQQQPEHLFGLEDGNILWGEPLQGPVLFQENGLTFEADPIHGQKTGFFLDQRDNRARVEALAKDMHVLNIFSYSDGFSVYAARGGARSVTSVDISQPALDAAQRNFTHNKDIPSVATAHHETIAGDAFKVLDNLRREKKRFDMVIIDPPSFAKNQADVPGALKAYCRLTRLGLSVLAPEGILVQASCSSRISSQDFFSAIYQEAGKIGRNLMEIERSAHPEDHPIGFPEGAYLKCLFARA